MIFHEAVARTLVRSGVRSIFGVVGDANLYMMDAFARLAGGGYYSMANEAGAVLAAIGYARTSGELGTATVTHGPALTNTVTALIEGVRAKSPVLLIAGDTATADLENLQNVAQREVVRSTGAGFVQVRTPETVYDDLVRAIRRALAESRPIVLNVPVEFQWIDIGDSDVSACRSAADHPLPDPERLDIATGLIAQARRPIIVAGWGAARTGRVAVTKLASRIGAPLTTTLKARDLFRGDPYNLGIFGTLSTDLANETIARSDVVIALGAGLNRWTSADGSLLRGKKLVHVDVDRSAIDRWSRADVSLVADAGAAASSIVELLDAGGLPASDFAKADLATRIAESVDETFTDSSTECTVDIRYALSAVDAAFPQDRTLVVDAGRFLGTAFRRLHVMEPSAYVHAINYGSIGLSIGTAVGAYVGAPDRPVLAVCGDGGFMLGGLAEFNSAVRHGIDLVVLLLNDSAYGAEYVQLRAHEMDPSISTFTWPDFAPIADSLGGTGVTVRNAADMGHALEVVDRRQGPVLIDVKLDPGVVPSRRN